MNEADQLIATRRAIREKSGQLLELRRRVDHNGRTADDPANVVALRRTQPDPEPPAAA